MRALAKTAAAKRWALPESSLTDSLARELDDMWASAQTVKGSPANPDMLVVERINLLKKMASGKRRA